MNILVVDDRASARRVLERMLSQLDSVTVLEADSLDGAKAELQRSPVDLVLIDIRLSDEPTDRGGLDLLRHMRESGLGTPAVMVTGSTELAEIREAMRQGAQDYVLKDELSPEMILPIVEGIRERASLKGEVSRLRNQVNAGWGAQALVGSSASMVRVRELVQRVADADAPVLIRGETGSGKELVARALHEESSRRDRPFVPVNCSALPGTLIESMIFGHEKGAFTGADRRVRGQLELAGAGTVLLDEIAEMPPELQAKLLRVLEDRRFRRLASEVELPLRARILAATHVDLEARINDGRFREDLFYRLNVVSISVPSLGERLEDVPELLLGFSSRHQRQLKFTADAIRWIERRRWPGNVRELRNAVERLMLLADDETVDAAAMERVVGELPITPALEIDNLATQILQLPERLGSKLDLIERAILHHAIETCGGNKSAAARLVGVDRKALERKWDRLGERE